MEKEKESREKKTPKGGLVIRLYGSMDKFCWLLETTHCHTYYVGTQVYAVAGSVAGSVAGTRCAASALRLLPHGLITLGQAVGRRRKAWRNHLSLSSVSSLCPASHRAPVAATMCPHTGTMSVVHRDASLDETLLRKPPPPREGNRGSLVQSSGRLPTKRLSSSDRHAADNSLGTVDSEREKGCRCRVPSQDGSASYCSRSTVGA